MTRCRLLVALSSLLFTLCAAVPAAAASRIVPAHLVDEATSAGFARVIVRLDIPFSIDAEAAGGAQAAAQRRAIAAARDALEAHLAGHPHTVVRGYDALPLVALEAGPGTLRLLAGLAGLVAEVTEDRVDHVQTPAGVAAVQAPQAWAAGYDGAGTIVAVLDTGAAGADVLSGKVAAQACFSSTTTWDGVPVTSLCADGAPSSAEADAAMHCPAEVSGCDHGPQVAAAVTAVAPGAGIMPIQVFSRFSAAHPACGGRPCALSFVSDQLAALSHVLTQRTALAGASIASVTMSLGSGDFDTPCATDPRLLPIAQLRAAGIATVVASGNSGFTDAMGAPACVPGAVSVGATGDGTAAPVDTVSAFSNSAPFLSLLAPADDAGGTSMAASRVAAAFAILRGANATASVDTLLAALFGTGHPVADTRVPCTGCASAGVVARRIDVNAALFAATLPDLAVTAAGTVPAALPGQSIGVSYTLANLGAAAGSFRVSFYLSRDSVFDGTDVRVGSNIFASLAAGASITPARSVIIPAATVPRLGYRILVRADADGVLTESSEGNNVRATGPITIGSDLSVSAAATVAAAMPGQSIVIDNTVKNSGAIAVGPFTVGFYLSTDAVFTAADALLGSRTVTSLPAGASSISAHAVTIPAGTPLGAGYRILVRADTAGAVAEVSESNNVRATAPITIGLDVAVTGASTVATAAQGQSIKVSHTLQNAGGAAAGPFTVGFYLSADTEVGAGDVLLRSRTVQTLAAGVSETRSILVTIPAATAAGTYRILVRADTQGVMAEADETNNLRATAALSITPPRPLIAIDDTSHVIFLPDNCSASFQIRNVGPAGTVMDYLVADDGSLGGFLDVQSAVGSLPAGASATVRVSVKPQFTDMPGATLVLSIYTPQAGNFVKSLVSIRVIRGVAPLLGAWSGTWSGQSFGRHNPGEPEPRAPVSGTWILDVHRVDRVNGTASGTLTWNGTDAYWTYVHDSEFNILSATPQPFIPNRTIVFDGTNTTLQFPTAGTACRFHLTAEGFAGAPNPSDEFYGPWFSATLDPNAGTVTSTGVGFSAHPYHPDTFDTALSSGIVTGRKGLPLAP